MTCYVVVGIMNISEIEDKVAAGEMTAMQVFTQMHQHIDAAAKMCAIYFDIAAGCIGEDKVRKLRDRRINPMGT